MTVARQLRDAVRACYDVTAWRRVAQPIFDTLRQRRRDALVAWVMHTDGFDRVEQLFEYFLVDPGTEPVLQTSRLRLAISAVQLFIQRCLLNLEPGVSPAAIDSEHWQWMKRYRVWEANRKIFLWPENWLEPEFRDDKTHLFQALESSLFQGDVTNDLAEDAFFGYLRSLEALARLDIRAIYVEEDDDPLANTLHVVGRTFGAPHRYFYRSYSYGMWTPWVPVTAEIEGDHLVAAVWRERLHLFWVTFVESGRPQHRDPESDELAEVPADELLGPRRIDAHLHWTEYYQGEWTDPVSERADDTGHRPWWMPLWSPADEQVHVSHDGDALLVHISGRVNQAFRVESKNSPPVLATVLAPPEVPYSAGLADTAMERVASTRSLRSPSSTSTGSRTKATGTSGRSTPRPHRSSMRAPTTRCRVAGNQLSARRTRTSPRWSARCFYQDSQSHVLRRAGAHRDHARRLGRMGDPVGDAATGARR